MMERSPEEIAALRESFRKMDTAHKAEYIYMYYKWFILLGLVVIVIFSNTLYRHLTKKDVAVYLGMVNVSVGTELEQTMTAGFLESLGRNPKKNEVLVYNGLYLSDNAATEDHQYAYASQMKVMASASAQRLDVVLMNQEGYDLLSRSGYLLALNELPESLHEYLEENEVVLESNAIEVELNTADEYRIVTQKVCNGLNVSTFPLFRQAGFDGTVYMGIIANTPRYDNVTAYLEYLLACSPD